jgi:hypothetical protein
VRGLRASPDEEQSNSIALNERDTDHTSKATIRK